MHDYHMRSTSLNGLFILIHCWNDFVREFFLTNCDSQKIEDRFLNGPLILQCTLIMRILNQGQE